MKSIIARVSVSLIPRVVMACIPIRSPDGRNGGLGSSGIVDLLVEIPILSRVFSAREPSRSVHEKSTTTI